MDELEQFRRDEQQRHEWEHHAIRCERQGVCPHSGEKFAVCKATICDCFDYDYEARTQWWERLKFWWGNRQSSPRNWHRLVAWWLWGKRRNDAWMAEHLPLRDGGDHDGRSF